MSYKAQSLMAKDNLLLDRITACATARGIENADDWVRARSWQFAVMPDWDAKYDDAIEHSVMDPGYSKYVITDADILAAVAHLQTQTPEPTE